MITILTLLFTTSNHSQPLIRLGYYPILNGTCIETDDSLMYICSSDTLFVLNISEYSNIKLLKKHIFDGKLLQRFVLRNGLLFTTLGENGIYIIDISDYMNPIILKHINGLGFTKSIFLDSNYLYVSCASEGIRIFDISDIQNPQQLSQFNTGSNANDVKVKGNLAFIADMGDGVRILDITDKSNPIEIGYYDTPGLAHNLLIQDTLLFVTDGSYGVHILGISNPAQPYKIYTHTKGSYVIFTELGISGKTLILGANSEISAFDFSDLSKSLIYLGGEQSASIYLKCIGDTILNCNVGLFRIYRIDRQTIVEEKIPNKEYSLSQNYPNPFNSTTIIKYEIPTSPHSSHLNKGEDGRGSVTLKIYDILGREVETLVNEEQPPGIYNVKWNASRYTSGIYYYELTVSNGSQPFRKIKKMIYLK